MLRKLVHYGPWSSDLGLLVLRVASAGLLLTHGWPKLVHYKERLASFADPLGLGSEISLTLVVMAEVGCSILVALGLFTRFALIPLIVLMIVIVFIVHADDPFGRKELPLLFLASFGTLFFSGPGKISADGMRGR